MGEQPFKNTYELRKAVKEAAEHEDGLWQTKEQYYVRIGEELINAGCPPDQISKVGLRLLDRQLATLRGEDEKDLPSAVSRPHWWRVMKKNKWTDQTFNRDPDNIHKKEGSDTDSEEDESEDSEEDSSAITKRASDNSEIVNSMGRLSRAAIMVKWAFASLESRITDDDKQYKLLVEDLEHTVQEIEAAVSGRPKIAPNTHHIWKAKMATEHGLRKAASAYLRARADVLDRENERYMDAKQARKYTSGREPNMMEAYKPRNQDDALYRNYLGVPCKTCGSWRVKSSGKPDDDAQCVDCDHIFPSNILTHHMDCGMIITEPVEECPRCGGMVNMPQQPQTA